MRYEISLRNLRTNCNTHKFRRVKQEQDESWDSFISRLQAERQHCEFPAGGQDSEVLITVIENGRIKEGAKEVIARSPDGTRSPEIR